MVDQIRKLQVEFERARDFLLKDLWRMNLSEVPRLRRQLYALLRVGFIVVKGYIRDNCSLQASALTYASLMSLVPILALTFSVAKGLGTKKRLMEILNDSSSTMPVHIREFIQHVFELVDQTNLTALGLIGLFLLFWTVVKVMWKVESTFNAIWGVRVGRTMIRRFTDYIFMVISVPLLILAVSAINTAMSTETVMVMMESALGPAAILYKILLRIFGIVLVSLSFFILYLFMPNTKVNVGAAIIGGLSCGILWLGWQWLCINVQMLLSGYNTLYGAFATIPVSLFWVWLNWNIILFGAEVTFAFQNYRTYTLESESATATFATRRALALLLVQDVCRHFRAGKGPWKSAIFQARHNVSIRLVRQVLFELADHKVLIEIPEQGFVPGRDIHTLTLQDVELAVRGKIDEHIEQITTAHGGRQVIDVLADDRRYIDSLKTTDFSAIIDEVQEPDDDLEPDIVKPAPAPTA